MITRSVIISTTTTLLLLDLNSMLYLGRRALRQPGDSKPTARYALLVRGAAETAGPQERGETLPHAAEGYTDIT